MKHLPLHCPSPSCQLQTLQGHQAREWALEVSFGNYIFRRTQTKQKPARSHPKQNWGCLGWEPTGERGRRPSVGWEPTGEYGRRPSVARSETCVSWDGRESSVHLKVEIPQSGFCLPFQGDNQSRGCSGNQRQRQTL